MKRVLTPRLTLLYLPALLAIVMGLSACVGGASSSTQFYYSVGGSVSGLGSGKSMLLQNNSVDEVTVSADGSFTFPTAMLSGSTYKITVYNQPADQTCTVINSSGAIFDSNVTDVAVTCVTHSFTVGGNVSGLGSGKSVILQNNGGDDLTVGADGTFTFATAIDVGAPYSATVLTQPANQTCTVVNGGGTMSSANVTNLAVTCRAWGAAALIESGNAGAAANPQVAVDGNGNAIAVWSQSDGLITNIWANRYLAGSGWLTPILIETDDSGNAQNPRVAMDGNGNAIAVWSQSVGGQIGIWANRYLAGSGWFTPTLIVTDITHDAQNPQVAVDASGNAFAVWQQFDGTRNNIWANRYTAGWGWDVATLIEADTHDAQNPQVATDASGNALAVWQQSDGVHTNIWSNRYSAGSTWGTAALIETDNAGDAQSPQIAFDANGNALAVWQQSDGMRTNIWANRFAAGGTWGSAALIETDDTGAAQYPQIAFDGNGNALAVWQQSDGTRTNILANRYTAGATWGTAALIETDTHDAQNPQVAIDASGNALAVWQQSDGISTNIWANRYTAGNAWGTAALIETDTHDAQNPQVAVDSKGNAVAVWQQSDGTRDNIWANLYR